MGPRSQKRETEVQQPGSCLRMVPQGVSDGSQVGRSSLHLPVLCSCREHGVDTCCLLRAGAARADSLWADRCQGKRQRVCPQGRAWEPPGHGAIWPSALLRFWHGVSRRSPPGTLGERMGAGAAGRCLACLSCNTPTKAAPRGRPQWKGHDHLTTQPAVPGRERVLAAG